VIPNGNLPKNYDLHYRRSGALMGCCRDGFTRYASDVPDWLKFTPLARLGDVIRVMPVGHKLTPQEIRRGMAPIEVIIHSMETALQQYDRTEAGRRDRRARGLRELLAWKPPDA
jgi:hypothetical protein